MSIYVAAACEPQMSMMVLRSMQATAIMRLNILTIVSSMYGEVRLVGGQPLWWVQAAARKYSTASLAGFKPMPVMLRSSLIASILRPSAAMFCHL